MSCPYQVVGVRSRFGLASSSGHIAATDTVNRERGGRGRGSKLLWMLVLASQTNVSSTAHTYVLYVHEYMFLGVYGHEHMHKHKYSFEHMLECNAQSVERCAWVCRCEKMPSAGSLPFG